MDLNCSSYLQWSASSRRISVSRVVSPRKHQGYAKCSCCCTESQWLPTVMEMSRERLEILRRDCWKGRSSLLVLDCMCPLFYSWLWHCCSPSCLHFSRPLAWSWIPSLCCSGEKKDEDLSKDYKLIKSLCSVPGLYIWNGAATVCGILSVILWGAQNGSLSDNMAVQDTLRLLYPFDSTGQSSFGYSFYLIIASIVLHGVINIGMLYWRQRIINREPPPVTIQLDKPEGFLQY